MKLYTEEQVKKAIELTYLVELYGTRDAKFRHTPDEIVEKLTSIELPIDEEIEKNCYYFPKYDDSEFWAKVGFLEGAKWMRDKILQNESNT